jgi:threonine dehydratase
VTIGLPNAGEIEAARKRVYEHLRPTPLLHYPGIDALVGTTTWIKHENHHGVGAFKVRGGVNLAASLTDPEARAGLFTASTGNHGLSISFAGKIRGAPVTVGVPEGANPSKVAAMEGLGAGVVTAGKDFDEAREWAMAEAERHGGRFVGPTEPELIAGVASYAAEILDELPDVDVIVVPVGSGSGATAVCLTVRTRKPEVEVTGVQAEAAPAAHLTWKRRTPTEAAMETDAEGLATRVPFPNTQSVLQDPEIGLTDFRLVSEESMRDAVRLLLEHTHNLAELAGAAPLAAALGMRDHLAGKRVVLVLSGGNLALPKLRKILAD